jgi:hypothetical protein
MGTWASPPNLTFYALLLLLLLLLFIGMIRRIQLRDLKELTYEALTKEILSLAAGSPGEEQPPPPIEEDDLKLTYTDVDGHVVTIGSTKEFVYAIQDSLNQGHALITACASKKKEAKTPPPVPPTAPTTTTHVTTAVQAEQHNYVPSSTSIPVTPDASVTPSRKRNKAATGDISNKSSSNGRNKKSSRKKLESDATEAAVTAAIVRPVAVVSRNAAASMIPAQLFNEEATTITTTMSAFEQPRSVRSKICSALMELRALNIHQPPRAQVALFSGYSNIKSAGFAKALTHLKKEGFIQFPNKKSLQLDASCIDKLPVVQAPVDNTAVQTRLRVMLKGKKGKVGSSKTDQIFEQLTDGMNHTRETVALATGYTNVKSAGFSKALGTLSGLGMLSYPDKKSLALTDICFPYGRPAAMPDTTFKTDPADVVTPDQQNSIG